MLSKIEYVYDKDKEKEVQLLGARVISFDGENINKQEFYVGISYNIEELFNNTDLVESLGINDLNSLKRRMESCNALGIVYFPQIQKFHFLESDDIILPYQNDITVEEVLEETIAPFRENTMTKEDLKNYVDQKFSLLSPDDARRELHGLPLSKHKISAR